VSNICTQHASFCAVSADQNMNNQASDGLLMVAQIKGVQHKHCIFTRLMHQWTWNTCAVLLLGLTATGFCGCQEWQELQMDLRDELIFRFVLVPRSWSRLCVLLYLCFRWIRKRLCGLQTSCLWTSDIVICALMCQNLSRRSVSRVIVAHLCAAPWDKCVCNFVHLSAKSQGTDMCLY